MTCEPEIEMGGGGGGGAIIGGGGGGGGGEGGDADLPASCRIRLSVSFLAIRVPVTETFSEPSADVAAGSAGAAIGSTPDLVQEASAAAARPTAIAG